MTITPPPYSVVPVQCRYNLVHYAMHTPEDGCFVEVGVYQGGTAWHLAQVAEERGVPIFLYDTFSGIPYQGELDAHEPGDFDDTSADAVRAAIPYATVVEGLFPDSIVRMPPVSFAHIDCDQYQSIIDTVRALTPRMLKGGIMVFDDYGYLDSATQAVHDLFADDRIGLTRCRKAWVQF